MLLLVVIQGPDKGRVLSAHRGTDLMLGRDPGDGALSDRRVGPRHARVGWSAGRWWVHAEAGGSGVSVNGRPSRVRAEVRSGDVLRLGGTTLVAAVTPGVDLERSALLDDFGDPPFNLAQRRAGKRLVALAAVAALAAITGLTWLAVPQPWVNEAAAPPPAASTPGLPAVATQPPDQSPDPSPDQPPAERPIALTEARPIAEPNPRQTQPVSGPAPSVVPTPAPTAKPNPTAFAGEAGDHDPAPNPQPAGTVQAAASTKPQPTLSQTELAYKLAFELGRPMPLGRGLTDPVTGEPIPPRVLQPSDALAEGFTHWRQWYEHDIAAQKRRLSELAQRYRQNRHRDPLVITLPELGAPSPRQPLALQPDPPADADRPGSSPLDASP